MSLSMDSTQLVHMLNISYTAFGCTKCTLVSVLYIATHATANLISFHCIQHISMDGTTTKIDLNLATGTEGPHFEMAGIQLAVQLRATYQHFGPPAECAVSLNAFTKPAACGMTTRMCSGLTVLLFLKPPFLKLTCFAFNFQPWIAVIRIDFPHEFK